MPRGPFTVGVPRVWYVLDCCGSTTSIAVYMLIFMVDCGLLSILDLSRPLDVIHLLVYNTFAVLAGVCHARAMLTDPGSLSPEQTRQYGAYDERRGGGTWIVLGETVSNCRRCKHVRPIRAHHCSTCQCCILEMDHHCPWINNCVGRNNHKFFVLFCLYICICATYALGVVASRLINCLTGEEPGCGPVATEPSPILWGITAFSCLVFGLFTCIMCLDQTSNLLRDQTGVEKLKGHVAARHCSLSNMQRVCGPGPHWRWFGFAGSARTHCGRLLPSRKTELSPLSSIIV